MTNEEQLMLEEKWIDCLKENKKLKDEISELKLSFSTWIQENTKLKAEIEQANGIISRDMDKHDCYVISKSIEVNNLKIEIKQLKSELEQSIKLPCKVRYKNDKFRQN